MLEKRFAASSVVLKNETLWVVGGHDGYNELSSTEFLTIDQPPVRGPGTVSKNIYFYHQAAMF